MREGRIEEAVQGGLVWDSGVWGWGVGIILVRIRRLTGSLVRFDVALADFAYGLYVGLGFKQVGRLYSVASCFDPFCCLGSYNPTTRPGWRDCRV